MNRLEVRCCCDASKLLGTLPAPSGDAWEKVFAVPSSTLFGSLSLPIGQYRPSVDGDWVRAYKADGVSIETLRKIPGFIEAMP